MTLISETASFVAIMIFNLMMVGILISSGVAIALKLTRGASPRVRYVLVVISFLAAAVTPFVSALIPSRNPALPEVIERSNTEDSHETYNQSSRLDPIALQHDSSDLLHKIPVRTVESVARLLLNSSISMGLFLVWLIGAFLLLGREVIGHLRVARARRAWRPASSDIREQLSWPENIKLSIDNDFGPCVLGVMGPTVVLPAHLIGDFGPRAARQVARHELDHVKWRDPLMNTVMRLICACLWPILPLWYLHRAACLEREAAADRAVFKASSADVRPDITVLEYASTLLSIAKKGTEKKPKRRSVLTATEVGREPGLNDRVRRLMAISLRPKPGRSSLAVITLLTSVSAVAILPVAKLGSQNKQTTSEDGPARTFANNLGSEVGGAKEHLSSRLVSSPDSSLLLGGKPAADSSNKRPMSPNASAIDDDATVGSAMSPVTQETQTPSSSLSINVEAQDFQSRMAAVGYRDLSPSQLADMKAYAVSPAYVAEMVDSGYGGLSADMLLRFKSLAVSSAFIREMKALGYGNLSPRMLVDFRQQAVSPAYVAEMADLGYSGLSADMLLRFKWLAVSSAFIREMKALGYDNLNPQTLADFRQQGVSSTYIREMRSLVSGPIAAEQLVSLRLYGASTEFVRQIKALGYERVNADQLISMRLQGVTVAYIEDMRSRGFKDFSVDQLIGMRMRRGN